MCQGSPPVILKLTIGLTALKRSRGPASGVTLMGLPVIPPAANAVLILFVSCVANWASVLFCVSAPVTVMGRLSRTPSAALTFSVKTKS
jgi:hypothetical protein